MSNVFGCNGSFPLSGDIKQMTVPWLFQSIRTRSLTGTAIFEHIQSQSGEKAEKKVYFKNGDVTFASSSLASDRLGDYLLGLGKITQAQFDASVELMKKTGKKQGAILVELGFLKPQELVNSVKEHVKRIVLSLFSVRMGSYRFVEGPLPLADIVPLQMSTGNLILEGVTNLEWSDIRKSLPSPMTVIRPAADPSCLFQDAHLDSDQRTVFSFVDGKRTIEEICGLSGVGDYNALKAVYLLLALRMVEIGELKTAEEMQFAREAVREAVQIREEKKPEAPPKPAEPEMVATREMILAAYDALKTQTHYDVLGVGRSATSQEIKKAYFRLAKAYHPDRHFDPSMADLKDKLDTLFDRIHKAYDVLSSDAKRSEYDRSVHVEPSKQAPQAAAGEYEEKHAEDYVENYAEKAARAAEQFNNGVKEFKIGNYWGAVEAFTWATRLDPLKAHYFFYQGICLTNIPRRKHEAEENLIKAIEIDPTKVEYHLELSNLYLKAGMKSKALAVLNNALQHVSWVEKIQQAIAFANEGKTAPVIYEHMKEPQAAERKTGVQKVDRVKAAQAQEKFSAGMKEFRVGNFGAAVNSLSEAVRLDPTKAEYFYYYGMCLARIARRQAEAEEALRKALELEPAKLEHHLELGNYYLRSGHKAKALGIFNNALLRFPNSEKIMEGIRTAGGSVNEQRPEDKKSGLFGKLFKT